MDIRPPSYLSSFESANRAVPLIYRFVAWVCDPPRADGVFVTEQELTTLLDIISTPMREVLHQAQMIGLIRREPNRKIEIPALTLHDMEQLSITREHLEALIAMSVAQRVANGAVSIEPLDKIHRRIRALAQVGDMELQLEAGLEFHAQMRVMSGNAVAARLLDQLMIGLERYRQLVADSPSRGEEIVGEHELILEAVAAGDVPRAAQVARAHIEQARTLYRHVLTRRFANART
jgi:DNA-binding GntR family transcriptional regulator